MTDTTELTNAELADELDVRAQYREHYDGESRYCDLKEAARRLRAMDEPVDEDAIARSIISMTHDEQNGWDRLGGDEKDDARRAARSIIEALGRKVKV